MDNIHMGKKYYKHKIENLVNVLKIITIHYFEFDKTFASKKETHDFWELVYPIKNNIILTANGEDILLKQNQMYFHFPNQEHCLRADGILSPDVFIISFASKSQSMHFFDNKILTIDKSLERYIYSIIEESKNTFDIPVSNPNTKKMELKQNRNLGGLQIIKNELENLLIHIMRDETQNSSSNSVFLIKENYKGNLSGEITKYLNEHVYDKITISMLEETFNYNKSYLFAIFKKNTGHSIIEYLNLIKIEKAKQLLLSTNLSVIEISNRLSFDTPSYFCKVFKNILNMTPLKYRKCGK